MSLPATQHAQDLSRYEEDPGDLLHGSPDGQPLLENGLYFSQEDEAEIPDSQLTQDEFAEARAATGVAKLTPNKAHQPRLSTGSGGVGGSRMQDEDESTDEAVKKFVMFLGKKKRHEELTSASKRLTDEVNVEQDEVTSMQAAFDNAKKKLGEAKERLHKKARELQENTEELLQSNPKKLNEFVEGLKLQI